MRPLPALAAVLVAGVAGTMLSLAGHAPVVPQSAEVAASPHAASATMRGEPTAPAPTAPLGAEGDAGPAQTGGVARRQTAPARAVAPDLVAPPPLDPAQLQRTEPRQPLSDLALARPPKPLPPDKWKGTLLHRPVAVASARFEATGLTVALSGVDGVEPDETCAWEEHAWPCGVRARAAFRAWLRGRSLSCAVPPEADRHLVVATCRLGKQDVAGWLVANGWARAAAGGPYAEVGRQAREKRLGVFGPPPSGAVPQSSFELPPSAVPEAELPDFDRLEAAPAVLSPDAAAPGAPG